MRHFWTDHIKAEMFPWLPDSPIYRDSLQFAFWHSIIYTIFEFSHDNFLLIFHILPPVILTLFVSKMYGQAVHVFSHLCIPFSCLLGYCLRASGTLALIKSCLKFACLRKAVSGGVGKAEARCWSWLFMALQCFACMLWIGGRRGSYVRAKTGVFKSLFFRFMVILWASVSS